MSNVTGTTKSIVRLRTEPSPTSGISGLVGPNMAVEILKDQGEWLQVKFQTSQGYVNRFFIELGAAAPTPGTPPPPPGIPVAPGVPSLPVVDPAAAPLEPPANTRLSVPSSAPYLERLVGDVWNKYGGLLSALSNQLQFDPAVAVAVFAIESGGNGFGPDGRMVIRFENHIFYNYWGKANESKFRDHFRFDPNQRWTGHQFRRTKAEAWQDQHVRKQSVEWDALNFASSLSSTAARLSISMGGPQIMGFNFEVLGFNSVHEMFEAFSSGDRAQIIAFFEFVEGPPGDNRRVEALQKLDFVTFAKYYNGPGQAAKYGGLIKNVYDMYHRLRR